MGQSLTIQFEINGMLKKVIAISTTVSEKNDRLSRIEEPLLKIQRQ